VRGKAVNLDLVDETGDHPLSGSFCPGRHRKPWTVFRVRHDAAYRNPRPRPGRHALELPALTTGDWWRANREAEELMRALQRYLRRWDRSRSDVHRALDVG